MDKDAVIAKLSALLNRSPLKKADLTLCCKELLESFQFDCVLVALAGAIEEPLTLVALEGPQEVAETCLYRLGVEEKTTLTKVPLKTFSDMTGKPIFNKSGSLRMQKPSSGIFLANFEPGSYILLGLGHQVSKSYPTELLQDLSTVWQTFQPLLRDAVGRLGPSMAAPEAAAPELSPPPPDLPKMETPFDPLATAVPRTAPVPTAAPAQVPGEEGSSGRRPLIVVDEVTRLFNKAFFEESLVTEVERAKRYSRNMSLLFLGVGHRSEAAGPVDERKVAMQIAEILSKSLRRVDFICRLDHSLYAIILPDTANNTHGIIAKRIFKFFKQVMGDNPPVFLNVSAATYPKHATTPTGLRDAAQNFLGQAREVGPNKAVLPE